MIRILYIDDEADTEQFAVLFEVLKSYDIQLSAVKDVVELDEAISRSDGALDCIVLDIIMPPGDYDPQASELGRRTGILALERIRHKLGNIPVVVATVTSRRDIRVQARERGVCEIIMKPFLASELVEAIKRAVEDNAGARNDATFAD